MNMKIKADFHIHTRYSHDSRTTLKSIIKYAKKKGLGAVALTDHNICGYFNEINNNADKNGLIEGIIVVPGVEYSTDKGHILGLFIEKEIKESELGELKNGVYDYRVVINAIRNTGGITVLAHPFIYGQNFNEEIIQAVDGIECYNARAVGKHRDININAAYIAKKYNKLFTGGSDAHLPQEIGNGVLELDLEEKSIKALKSALLTGRVNISGNESPLIYGGISQIQKQFKLKTYKKLPRKIAALILFFILDIFKFIGLIHRDKGSITIREGELNVCNSQNRKKD